MNQINIHFSDFFDIDPKVVEDYGAFDVSLVNDVPVFIDPFRLYASQNAEYNRLHGKIIDYLRFLRDYCEQKASIEDWELREYFSFPEVRNIYMGFCKKGNAGRGLGLKFAIALRKNLSHIVPDFGNERISESSHLEKLCIISDDVGRDCISDFTANLLMDYLLQYTQEFANKYLSPERCANFAIKHAVFDFEKKVWKDNTYYLPEWNGSHVILVPRDFLTRNDTWISKDGLLCDFKSLPETVGDDVLKGKLSELISQVMDEKKRLTGKERRERFRSFYREHLEVVDWYIKRQEGRKLEALELANSYVAEADKWYVKFTNKVAGTLNLLGFYDKRVSSIQEARERATYFKQAIESNDVYRLFFINGECKITEEHVQLAFRLVWYGTKKDVNRETNNGRGPVDYKVSEGGEDKCLIEFKLASNSRLEDNLKNQLDIYKEANDTKYGLCVIVYTNDKELEKMERILKRLDLQNNPNIITIDAREKTSASKVR